MKIKNENLIINYSKLKVYNCLLKHEERDKLKIIVNLLRVQNQNRESQNKEDQNVYKKNNNVKDIKKNDNTSLIEHLVNKCHFGYILLMKNLERLTNG